MRLLLYDPQLIRQSKPSPTLKLVGIGQFKKNKKFLHSNTSTAPQPNRRNFNPNAAMTTTWVFLALTGWRRKTPTYLVFLIAGRLAAAVLLFIHQKILAAPPSLVLICAPLGRAIFLVFLFISYTNEEHKKAGFWQTRYFVCHMCRPHLWRHWYSLLGTKYSQSCFRDFQA